MKLDCSCNLQIRPFPFNQNYNINFKRPRGPLITFFEYFFCLPRVLTYHFSPPGNALSRNIHIETFINDLNLLLAAGPDGRQADLWAIAKNN